MNRDALLATLIGLGMGLFITGIIVIGPNLFKLLPKLSFPKITLPVSQPAITTPTTTPLTYSFSVDSPLSDAILSNSELLVSGKSYPDARVVVQSTLEEDVVLTDGNGSYAGKVTLSEGKNDIIVTSYSDSKIEQITVTIFYIPNL